MEEKWLVRASDAMPPTGGSERQQAADCGSTATGTLVELSHCLSKPCYRAASEE